MIAPGEWAVEVRTIDLLNGAGPVDYFYVSHRGKAVGGLSPNVKHAGLARTIEEVERRVPADVRALLVREIGG